MAKEPDSAVVRILQQIQATSGEHGRKLDEHTQRFDQLNVELRDIRERTVTALGLSAQANVPQELQARVARLEERAS